VADESHEKPSVTVDIVVVAQLEGQRCVLLVRRRNPPFQGRWALPGGFVEPNEPLEKAARRELWEETGVLPKRLEQLHTFGEPGRDPRGWTISVVFLAQPDKHAVETWEVRASSDAGEVGWFKLATPPPLAFDHAAILDHAIRHLERQRGSSLA
jgi:8-oxo-dGTP diphosphatase